MAPTDGETVCLFAQFLARSFKAPQSIMNYVASVKLWHTLLDLIISLFSSIEFKLTKRGLFRIMQHTVRQASPITPEILYIFPLEFGGVGDLHTHQKRRVLCKNHNNSSIKRAVHPRLHIHGKHVYIFHPYKSVWYISHAEHFISN